MPKFIGQKRKHDSSIHRRPASKKVRRQEAYSSGSEESEQEKGFVARDAPPEEYSRPGSGKLAKDANQTLTESGKEDRQSEVVPEDEEENSEAEPSATDDLDESDDKSSDITSEDNEDGVSSGRKLTKRRDPDAFANSLAAILSSKLPASKRKDPVLARSRDAEEANKEINDSKLEVKAKRKLRDEKRLAKERGRVKDVLLGDRGTEGVLVPNDPYPDAGTMSAAQIAEQERRLRKTAQRGVVKLFNAVRAAQVRSEQASRSLRAEGVVGYQQREEKVGEMGRQAFLDMISGGGKAKS